MYGKDVGVDKLNIEIKEEEFFVLVGPSGAGKTTTLKMVAGIIKPTEGKLFIDGVLSNLIPPHERNVSMTFESYALYPHFSVYNNIANPLRRQKRNNLEADIEREVHRIAAMLEIEHILDQKPGELSGGQKQRVSLGRALVRQPAVFLLDEPLSHVDAKVRHKMRVELNRCGKTSSMRMIVGLETITSGEIYIGDRLEKQ
ncbi:sn-glycerol-3-phosphate import ATP-binding protein UgpC-like [Aplysia californica]|uniref:Sn-glycerol-3-phosphate import ATP-binding protein UgpC-like n=1 Tax=Aplysia californica TaxID=6500 RepID=A0ABM1W4P4_APLCA|nr:sn-glycerol-3-phosphate import ATP-binding protein UgpC-like [Aplysia californica]